LAYGNYRITSKVNDITPIERSGEDLVMSAAEAARDLIRPGRPWPHHFSLGEEPVAATRKHDAVCHESAQLRVRDAEVQIQNRDGPTSKKVNSNLVNSIVTALLDENFRGAIDFDFDADDIVALHEVAVNFRNSGLSTEVIREHMLDLTGALREMIEEDVADNGEIVDDEI